jgi:hypothetical protein
MFFMVLLIFILLNKSTRGTLSDRLIKLKAMLIKVKVLLDESVTY